MLKVYVIESIKDGTRYTGIALDERKRLSEHNAGKNRFTKGHLPWKIIYSEIQPDWATARVREKYFKSAAGRRRIQKIIEGSASGSPPD